MEIVTQIDNSAQGIFDFTSILSGKSNMRYYVFLLYLIPILSCFNAVMQWTGKYPRLAFYLTLAPVGICIALIVYAAKIHLNISEIASFGFYITLLAGIVSFIATWTTIGSNYYAQYKGYLKFLTICALVDIALTIIVFIITMSMSYTSLMEYDMLFLPFMFLGSILGIITFLHLPFIVYAWIVVLLTKDSQNTIPVEAVDNIIIAPSYKPIEKTEQMAQPTVSCPQCHKEMSADWKLCPYCGCNPQETKKKEPEDDNLRFAPPQWRNNE